jgi:hypothetical protein
MLTILTPKFELKYNLSHLKTENFQFLAIEVPTRMSLMRWRRPTDSVLTEMYGQHMLQRTTV